MATGSKLKLLKYLERYCSISGRIDTEFSNAIFNNYIVIRVNNSIKTTKSTKYIEFHHDQITLTIPFISAT